jgi:hypothetical protein
VGGRTALAWRSEWDRPADAVEFHAALQARFARRGPASGRGELEVFAGDGGRRFALRRDRDAVELWSADDEELLRRLVPEPGLPPLAARGTRR